MKITIDNEQIAAALERGQGHQRIQHLCQQLKSLTPSELRLLQNEINHSLQHKNSPVLTHEELSLISSLF